MIKNSIITSCVILLTACGATLQQLDPITAKSSITIDETYSYKESRGIANTIWHFGLVKGEYLAAALDDKGTYYIGSKGSIIILFDTFGDKFLQSGELPSSAEKMKCCHGSWFGNSGGVWIPNNPSIKPKLFLIADYSDQAVQDQADKNTNDITPALTMISGIAQSAQQGNIIWGPEINDTGLLNKLVIEK